MPRYGGDYSAGGAPPWLAPPPPSTPPAPAPAAPPQRLGPAAAPPSPAPAPCGGWGGCADPPPAPPSTPAAPAGPPASSAVRERPAAAAPPQPPRAQPPQRADTVLPRLPLSGLWGAPRCGAAGGLDCGSEESTSLPRTPRAAPAQRSALSSAQPSCHAGGRAVSSATALRPPPRPCGGRAIWAGDGEPAAAAAAAAAPPAPAPAVPPPTRSPAAPPRGESSARGVQLGNLHALVASIQEQVGVLTRRAQSPPPQQRTPQPSPQVDLWPSPPPRQQQWLQQAEAWPSPPPRQQQQQQPQQLREPARAPLLTPGVFAVSPAAAWWAPAASPPEARRDWSESPPLRPHVSQCSSGSVYAPRYLYPRQGSTSPAHSWLAAPQSCSSFADGGTLCADSALLRRAEALLEGWGDGHFST
eukprot:TRINITY_DN18221_c1_g1_i1.p1 TRINITY_DN18221_c1_g1~~TRINITY_DN18221_c1_g1_i1.p1  ORF type:complete len:443 (+),score=81.18 TRINITY_DN18221_c1_g1_i1:88-1329(+)